MQVNMKEMLNLILRHMSEIRIWYRLYVKNEEPAPSLDTSSIKKKSEDFKLKKLEFKSPNEIDINNEIGEVLNLSDYWRFLRNSGLVSQENSLAAYNRVFFENTLNYNEMFLVPSNLSIEQYYPYIANLFYNSKKNFYEKHCRRDLNQEDLAKITNTYFFDYHDRQTVISIRLFFELLIRTAYIFYLDHPVSLEEKLKMLIKHIKTNNNTIPKLTNNKRTLTQDSNVSSRKIEDQKRERHTNFTKFLDFYEADLKKAWRENFKILKPNRNSQDATIEYKIVYKMLTKLSFFKGIEQEKFFEMISKNNIYSSSDVIDIFAIRFIKEGECIFYEFCEVIYQVVLKNLYELKLEESTENMIPYIEEITQVASKAMSSSCTVTYPKLKNHITYEKIIENEKRKKEEKEKEMANLQARAWEREMLEDEDYNVIYVEDEENEEEENVEIDDLYDNIFS